MGKWTTEEIARIKKLKNAKKTNSNSQVMPSQLLGQEQTQKTRDTREKEFKASHTKLVGGMLKVRPSEDGTEYKAGAYSVKTPMTKKKIKPGMSYEEMVKKNPGYDKLPNKDKRYYLDKAKVLEAARDTSYYAPSKNKTMKKLGKKGLSETYRAHIIKGYNSRRYKNDRLK